MTLHGQSDEQDALEPRKELIVITDVHDRRDGEMVVQGSIELTEGYVNCHGTSIAVLCIQVLPILASVATVIPLTVVRSRKPVLQFIIHTSVVVATAEQWHSSSRLPLISLAVSLPFQVV